jgi:hypothetical protein
MVGRILTHYMINGGFLGGSGEACAPPAAPPSFITTSGIRSLEPATDSRLCAIMDGLPPMSPFDRGGEWHPSIRLSLAVVDAAEIAGRDQVVHMHIPQC